MESLQYEYERFILGKHSRHNNIKSIFENDKEIKEDIIIDTKDYNSFINDDKYPENFRAMLYIFLREALGHKYSTKDGIYIKVKSQSKDTSVNITLIYKDYNNYDWKLKPNKVMSSFSKQDLLIEKISKGHIRYSIPYKKDEEIDEVFNCDDIVTYKEKFIDFISCLYENYNLNLNILHEIVDNIIYYEYNKRLLVKVNNKEIKILKYIEED